MSLYEFIHLALNDTTEERENAANLKLIKTFYSVNEFCIVVKH